ncbi:CoA ester lyase, partial [Corallococcus praedator]
IHPRQIDACNRLFSPSQAEIDWAKRVVDTFALPQNAAVNALTIDGRMVERLHLGPAHQILARA